MSKAIICDICKEPISEPELESFQLHRTGSQEQIDVCPICFTSPIILSEMRRTRTRKPKAKVGRPKGSKTQKTTNQESEKQNARINEPARAAV